ncbi:unnamed protein product [Owenia fusiformis]|uniref:Arylesterase n=1 Tax=Owenia fusiformis TaxID=6347 RepID=A0A8S4P806_OWEFU|nr:unnamed protein product [Owenia fusiformis]
MYSTSLSVKDIAHRVRGSTANNWFTDHTAEDNNAEYVGPPSPRCGSPEGKRNAYLRGHRDNIQTILNDGPGTYLGHKRSYTDPSPIPRVKPEAVEIYESHQGRKLATMMTEYGMLPLSGRPVARIKPEAQDLSYDHKGGRMANLLNNYGNNPRSARPEPRIKAEAESSAELDKGKRMDTLIHSYATMGVSARVPRVKPEAECSADLDRGKRMDKLLHKYQKQEEFTPRPVPRVKREAEDSAELDKGKRMDGLIHKYNKLPQSARPVPRVKPEANDVAEAHKGKKTEKLLHEYGELGLSVRPAPRVKPEAESTAERGRGIVQHLFHKYHQLPTSPRPQSRTKGGEYIYPDRSQIEPVLRHFPRTGKNGSSLCSVSSKMLKRIVAVVVFGILAQRIFLLVRLLGFHTTLYNHRPGPCRVVPGIGEGSEDMQQLSDGLTIISGGMKRFDNPSAVAEANGNLYLFDFNVPDANVEKLKIKGDIFNKKTFNPHGLSLFEDPKSGEVYVFVVNHPPEGDQIEKFTFDRNSKTLTHLQSIKHDTFTVLNDIVALDGTRFYVTRYDYFRHPALRALSVLFGLKWGSVIYIDTKKNSFATVATGMLTPNGINASPDKKYIYVANIGDRNIVVFKRDESDNSLTEARTLDLYAMTDNIDVDPLSGDLWLGVQAVGHLSAAYLADHDHKIPDLKAPSRVLYVKMSKAAEPQEVRDVFVDDTMIFASSVATRYKDAMLVGSVYHNMVYCQLKSF